jgi:hypothetical protein
MRNVELFPGVPLAPSSSRSTLVPPIRSTAHLKWLFLQMCEFHGADPDEILSSGHSRELVDFRRAFCKAARRHGYSSTSIGALIHRHHTTVLNLLK